MAKIGVYLILIGQENHVFLLKRSRTGFADGFFALPSGNVEAGEAIADAAVREAAEECGIQIEPNALRLVHVHQRRKTTSDERMDFFFACTEWAGNIQNLEPHKHAHVRSYSLSHLPKPMIPYHRIGLAAAVASPLLTHAGVVTYSYGVGEFGERRSGTSSRAQARRSRNQHP